MPSKSSAQARLMAGVAHNPAFAKKVRIPVAVGKEFNQADAGTGILSKRLKPGIKTKKAGRAKGWLVGQSGKL